MPRDKALFEEEKQEILQYYHKLDSEREFGVKKYLSAWCIAKTAKKYKKRPPTIEGYLYRS